MAVNPIHKNINFRKILKEVSGIAGLLWEKNWAESNAGNISYRLENDLKHISDKFITDEIKLKKSYKNLAGKSVVITCAGSRMRDIKKMPQNYLCLLSFSSKGKSYKIIKLSDLKLYPTSELSPHLEIHNTLTKINPEFKSVLHTHPSEIIAVSNIKKFNNEIALNNLLKSLHPEISFAFPEGIGLIKYILSGSKKLSEVTAKKFIKYNFCVWEKHGCISAGKTLADAFDKVDVIVKSLKIFFLCRDAGYNFEGLNKNQIKELDNYISKGYLKKFLKSNISEK